MNGTATTGAARAPLTVFYDGSCGLCQVTVAWALARDHDRALEPLPYQSDEAQARLGPERARRAAEELHVWSESEGVRVGADAIAAMLRRLPGWRWAGALLGWGPVLMLARPVYRAVAARRAGWRSCSLPAKFSYQSVSYRVFSGLHPIRATEPT